MYEAILERNYLAKLNRENPISGVFLKDRELEREEEGSEILTTAPREDCGKE